jgi:DNA-binding transcriptional MerR regulator
MPHPPQSGEACDALPFGGGVMNRTVQLEKPLYTLGVAAEMLGSHPRTLILYEELGVARRSAAGTNKWRFTLRDILALRAVSRLRRQYQMNLDGACQLIRCLQLLDAHHIPRPRELRGFDLEHVSL